MLRDQGRLPAELNRLPTKTVNEAITTSNKLKRSFQRYGDPQILRREYQQARHTWYEELLRNMETAFVQAFKNNDPAHRYPKGAIHAAISSILTPLLYYELRPRSNSTTPGAIQRRLSNRKIV